MTPPFITVLKLSQPIEFSRNIRAVCLPPKDPSEDYVGLEAIVSGWGTTEYDGWGSEVLLETTVTVWEPHRPRNGFNDVRLHQGSRCLPGRFRR